MNGDDGWRNLECDQTRKEKGVEVMIDEMAAQRKVPQRLRW